MMLFCDLLGLVCGCYGSCEAFCERHRLGKISVKLRLKDAICAING